MILRDDYLFAFGVILIIIASIVGFA